MYRDHWQLQEKPFRAAFDESLISFKGYFAENFHKMDLYLNNLPVTLCIKGPRGSGKSMFLRMVENSCHDQMKVVTLPGKYLNERLSLMRLFEESQPLSNTRSQRTLAQKVNKYFESSENLAQGMLVLIDDAHFIYDTQVLKDLAEVIEVCHSNNLPVCFLFVMESGEKDKLCPLVPHKHMIEFPLPSDEIMKDIILFRLEKSGARQDIFHLDALNAIIEMANHNIKELLMIADLCLQMGYVNKLSHVTRELVTNKVQPFLERFREEDLPHLRKMPQEEENGIPKINIRPRDADNQAQEVSNDQVKPEKMIIGKADLDSYKTPNNKRPPIKEILDLEKLIRTGSPDLAKAFNIKSKLYSIPEAKRKPEVKENPLDKLDAESFYQVGGQLVAGILEDLRNNNKVLLGASRLYIKSLFKLFDRDQEIIAKALDNSLGFGLNLHMLNVCILAAACTKRLLLTQEEAEETALAALLHDVGHLRSGENLLTSNNRFSRQEFRTIKEHPIEGKNMILDLTDGSQKLANIISQEHERDDGLGYPNYLVGNEIHTAAKIIAVCDAFEALTHSRAYRSAISPEDAMMRIRSGMIQQTDPRIINSLSAAIRPFI